MAQVIPIHDPSARYETPRREGPTEYELFEQQRRLMLAAYREWVRTGPHADDMDAEAECTLGAMHAIQVFDGPEVPHA